MPGQNYYPTLSTLIPLEKLPVELKSIIEDILNDFFYKEHISEISYAGDTAFHQLTIVLYKELGLKIGGENGLSLLLNPSHTIGGTTEIPVSISYNWQLLKLIQDFKTIIEEPTPSGIFDFLIDLVGLDEEELIHEIIKEFYFDSINPIQSFIDDFNNNPNYSGTLTLPTTFGIEAALDICDQLIALQTSVEPTVYIFIEFLNEVNDVDISFERIFKIFKDWVGEINLSTLKDIAIPKISASINTVEIALQFPHSMLKPLDGPADNINSKVDLGTDPNNPKFSTLLFNIGSLDYNSERGFTFNLTNSASLTPSQIGNTPVNIDINNIKIDLRDDSNIIEATLDGRPKSFKGIFAEDATIFLPWSGGNVNNATIKANNILIGTEGGFSGILSIQGAVYEHFIDFEIKNASDISYDLETFEITIVGENNKEEIIQLESNETFLRDTKNNYFKVVDDGTITSEFPPSSLLSYSFANGITISLDSFFVTFHQNSVIRSNIRGTLTVPSLNVPIQISVDIANGFLIKASVPKGKSIYQNDIVEIIINGLEIGKIDDISRFGFSGSTIIKSQNPFVSKFLPNNIAIKHLLYKSDGDLEFDVGVGWKNGSTVTGNNEKGLEIIIPIHKNSDKDRNIKIDSIKILANNDNENLNINTTLLGVVLSIGSLKATVSGLGFGAVIDFPDNGGNFGDANVDLELIPPNSIGLKIDSPSISGSGALKIDAANKRYFGYIQLKFGKVTFTAMGILRTELPGGKEGYSLILVITAENFKPIALGYGFNLIGVGGLIGLNRSVNIDVLRAGLKTGNNDKILFPVNVIENADSIISALDTSFPEKEGRFIFGPLAKINWGTGEESILTIDLGLIIEVPKPITVALIGVLKAIFPPNKDNSEENAKLIIKVNFLGVFDAEKKMISFDASIYDSKIASFTISGDMAFRLSYGENPGFLLSIGGFHPAYTPPPMDLPNLKRLSISLVDEKKSKVFLETYFAVTSNTVQFGARVIASAENGLYNFAAVLWFDALFQFKPFYFIVSMGGMIAIKSGGKTILTAGLDFTLQGPTPWKIDGKVYFEICKVKKSIKINKEYGKKLPEQNVDVLIEEILTTAIDNADNWQIINPRYADFVTIKGPDEKAIFLHPTGSISMNQSSVPLNLTFVKFGNSKPKDFSKFYLDNFKIGNEVIEETKLKNGFAPSMYRVMTNEQKLSAPSFEEYESGFIVGTDKISGDFFTKREVGHNKEIIDKAGKVKGLYAVEVDTIFNAMLDTNAQTFGGVSGSQNNRPYDSPPSVGVTSEKYTVTNRDTGSPYDSQTFDSFTDALDFSNSILNTNPAMKGKIKVVSTTQLN
jgi:hypothetical protein